MPTELRSAWRLAFACAPLLLSACGAVVDSSPTASGQVQVTATARAAVFSPSTSQATTASPAQTAAPSAPTVYVNETQGWSIVIPPGWDVAAQDACCFALHRDGVIAEVLVSPSGGLTLEQLRAEKVAFLGTWAGTDDLRSEIVRLPAGDAIRATLQTTTNPDTGPGIFVHYAIAEGDTQYVISARGPQDDSQLLADAEALAESIAILD